MSQRIVVTGIGMVTPLGLNTSFTWDAVVRGVSGVGPIHAFDAGNQEVKIAAEVKGFDPEAHLGRKESRRMDRFAQFAVVAAQEAARHASLHLAGDMAERTAVLIGSGMGGILTLAEQIETMREKGPSRVSPFLMPMTLIDMACGQVSIALGAKGPVKCPVTACATGADAIGEGFDMIQRGDVEIAIAGGAEASIAPIIIAGFAACNALSRRNDEPQKASRPFDAGRDGFVMAEGAAVVILESLESAQRRGAQPIVEIVGYAATADAYHLTQPAPQGEGTARAMRLALKRAHLKPEEIDYINAHGTSTPANDKFETMAIKGVFGEEAYKIPISSTKSMTGHLLGASGALEAAFCVLAIQTGVIPPTINLEEPDPDCDLDYTPYLARRGQVRTAMTNSMGFGGHNSSLIFQRFVQ
ncbi:MAG: beta-ketoacyl-[acyl-carrier-protein] synthase II [Dehalococcoidia bacterium]|nr:beta-ketoacyl-[acyl-carrier-protein] synthase II [Dehalococcoidia bacterium]